MGTVQAESELEALRMLEDLSDKLLPQPPIFCAFVSRQPAFLEKERE